VSVRAAWCLVMLLSDVLPDQSTCGWLDCATSYYVVQRYPATGWPPGHAPLAARTRDTGVVGFPQTFLGAVTTPQRITVGVGLTRVWITFRIPTRRRGHAPAGPDGRSPHFTRTELRLRDVGRHIGPLSQDSPWGKSGQS
jgi:hypothetical protein